MGFLEASVVVIGVAVAAAGWAVYQLVVQNGRLLLRLETIERRLVEEGILPDPALEAGPTGLPAGSVLNNFELPALAGGTMTLSQWLAGVY